MSRRILVLTGRGRYEDSWHDHAATSWEVGKVLHGLGHRVDIRGVFRDALLRAPAYDLVVVNTGRGRVDPAFDEADDQWQPAHATFATAVRDGLPVLALHQAANSFPDAPEWPALLGGRWVPGTSYHPPEEEAVFDLADHGHPMLADLPASFPAYDERYCSLEVAADSVVLVTTVWNGEPQPVAWLSGAAPAVLYDGLGHSVRSYESVGRRELLAAEVGWLLS